MRFIVIAVAVLAGLKVWTQDRLYRSATNDALVLAYRDKAERSCLGQEAGTDLQKERGKNIRLAMPSANPWAGAHVGAAISIGDPQTDVAMWDIENPLWDVRYRHAHLILTRDAATTGVCRFNLVAGNASLAH